MDTDSIKREVQALEDKRYQAMINKDIAALKAMFADSLGVHALKCVSLYQGAIPHRR